jgi:glucose/arabinose dehydrogenase
MKKNYVAIIAFVLIFSASIFAGIFYWNNLRGVWPSLKPSPQNIADILGNDEYSAENSTDIPLSLPKNFSISIFAKDLPGARVMVQDGQGNFWVSQRSEGTISFLEVEDGVVTAQQAQFRNLRGPHGLAVDPQNGTMLYFAEEDGISRVPLYTEAVPEKLIDLPTGGRHTTRTIAFGPDGRLYVSIGSSCDVCHESDARRAAIYSMNKDGSDFRPYARGLRNSVFFTWSYVDGRMWGTEMGRDFLGDNLPPDEINIIAEGNNYGWPTCYGNNIHDTAFDKKVYVRNPCEEPFTTASYIDLQAHSAPLGLAFVPEEGWPEDMWYDLLVAYHGSWNRSEPTGYKIMRLKLDAQGNFVGREEFISGWLTDEGALGRPVDMLISPGGLLYITDDKAGVVYKVTYKGTI